MADNHKHRVVLHLAPEGHIFMPDISRSWWVAVELPDMRRVAIYCDHLDSLVRSPRLPEYDNAYLTGYHIEYFVGDGLGWIVDEDAAVSAQ